MPGRSSTAIAGLVLGAILGSCGAGAREEWPAVPPRFTFEPPELSLCLQPPAFTWERRPLLRKAGDPGRCFTRESLRAFAVSPLWESETLPVKLKVTPDGRVVLSGDFYDQCSGTDFTPDGNTLACLRREFGEWRFLPDEEKCPALYYPREEQFAIAPGPRQDRAGDGRTTTGCS